MTAKNDITGDDIKTRASSDSYRDNWDRIFKKSRVDDSESESTEESAGKDLGVSSTSNV